MLKPLLFVVLLLTIFQSQGQSLVIDKGVKLKTGIYRSFEEFKNNSPSAEFNYALIEDPAKYGNFITGSGKVIFYKLKIDKKKAKTIGEIYGFCDGKNIYVAPSMPNITPKTGFSKISYLGRYCYFEDIGYQPVYTGNGTSSAPYLEETAIDINTGKVVRLSKPAMRDILAKDAPLLADFNNEKKKSKALKEYLISYSDKHSDEITR